MRILALMTMERAIDNIAASMSMEGLLFGDEQMERIKKIALGTLTVEEAILQIRKKYEVV